MNDRINIKIDRLNISFDILLVWFIYLPFVGWMYPFAFKKDDDFAMSHARQAFVMAVFFTFVPIILTFLTIFVPNSYRLSNFVVIILIYLSHLTYLLLSIFGFIKIKRQKRIEFPFIKRYADRLNI